MKLNQIIAIEKGIKSKAIGALDWTDKIFQKPSLFNGFTKIYKKKREGDEDVPPTAQKVERNAQAMLEDGLDALSELFDITLMKESGNVGATADVKVGEEVVLGNAPVTYLLFLEKQLTDLGTLVGRMPTLAPDQDWALDSKQGLYKAAPVITARTKKVQKALVLHPPTIEHPAQTQLIVEDENVGNWEHTALSGAIPETTRKALVTRIETLKKAVKLARERANLVDVEKAQVGSKIMTWLKQVTP